MAGNQGSTEASLDVDKILDRTAFPGVEFVSLPQNANDMLKDVYFEAGFLGSPIPEKRRWIGASADLSESVESCISGSYSSPTIVTFYTKDTVYQAHAAALRESVESFGLSCETIAVESQGAWELNCAFKPSVIRELWRSNPTTPILWLDADARLEMLPSYLNHITADVGLHKWRRSNWGYRHGWEVVSGTLWFNQTPLAGTLLDDWVGICNAAPEQWDQISLDAAWWRLSHTSDITTAFLPRAYVGIEGEPMTEYPVVRHLQASRAQVKRQPSIPKPSLDTMLSRSYMR